MKRGEILLHLVTHASYHRGHAAEILYGIDVAPPTTHLPVFLAPQRAADATDDIGLAPPAN